jgi:hypothetical protein
MLKYDTHLYHSDIRSHFYVMADIVTPSDMLYAYLNVLFECWCQFAAAYIHLKLVLIHTVSVPVLPNVFVHFPQDGIVHSLGNNFLSIVQSDPIDRFFFVFCHVFTCGCCVTTHGRIQNKASHVTAL